MKKWLAIFLPPLVVLMALTAALELYVRWREVPTYLLPAPSAVMHSMIDDHEELLPALAKTTEAALIGFFASAILGIGTAVILSSSKLVRNALYPYTVFFQTVPVVAIVPMLLIWFGAGLQSVAICAFVVSIFPVIANTLTGLLSTDPALSDLFTLYGSGAIARLFKLRLPYAMPHIITGLRVAAGLSVIGTIVGEFLAGNFESSGLGVVIVASNRYGHTDRVFAAILLASALGLAMLSILNLAGYLMLRRWHASAKN